VISSSHRPLPDGTQHSQHKLSYPRQDSNTQSHQASGRRPTPYAERPLGPAFLFTLSRIQYPLTHHHHISLNTHITS